MQDILLIHLLTENKVSTKTSKANSAQKRGAGCSIREAWVWASENGIYSNKGQKAACPPYQKEWHF